MAKMKVLQLISGIAVGAESGGGELHAIRIARHLPSERYASAIFSLQRYDSAAEAEWLRRIEDSGLPLYGMSPGQTSLCSAHRTLQRAVAEFQPDIVHSHSERTDTLNVLSRRRGPGGLRAVRTVHIDQKWITRPYLERLMEGYVLPGALDYQVAVSRTIYDRLISRRKGGLVKTGLCYNGIDEAAFAPGFAAQQQLAQSLPGEPPYVGIVGRLTRQKGHDLLLTALRTAFAERPGNLLIVGDGPLAGELRTQAEALGLGERVHFLGVRQDVWAILARLELFVLPSRWEGFPTVLLEAMSQFIPVIATDVSGSRELVRDGETGLLTPVDDAGALADAVRRLLTNRRDAEAMAERAFQRASRHTLQEMARCYATIYERVARTN